MFFDTNFFFTAVTVQYLWWAVLRRWCWGCMCQARMGCTPHCSCHPCYQCRTFWPLKDPPLLDQDHQCLLPCRGKMMDIKNMRRKNFSDISIFHLELFQVNVWSHLPGFHCEFVGLVGGAAFQARTMHANTSWITAFSDTNTEWTLRHWRAIIANLHIVWAWNIHTIQGVSKLCIRESNKKHTKYAHIVTYKLTLLIGSVLYAVGSISKVRDQGVRAAPRRVADEGFDVVASSLRESTSIHSEVCGRLTENT